MKRVENGSHVNLITIRMKKMNKSTEEIYNQCTDIEYDKRTDAEKAVVWQHNENKWLHEREDYLS